MSVSGLKIVSVYDPATGTVVQLSKIAPDGEFKKEALYSETTKGGLLYAGDDSSFEFLALDDTGFDQLETWMKALTPVRLVTYGLEDHILWYEDATITVKRTFGFKIGQRNGFTVKISKTGGAHNIKCGTNLLYLASGWADSNSDNKPDNYTIDGTEALTLNFATNIQTITVTSGGGTNLSSKFVYPISGVQIISQSELTDSTSASKFTNIIRAQDFSNANLLSNSIVLASKNTMVTPANIYYLNIFVATSVVGLVAGDKIAIKFPFVGVDTLNYKQINY